MATASETWVWRFMAPVAELRPGLGRAHLWNIDEQRTHCGVRLHAGTLSLSGPYLCWRCGAAARQMGIELPPEEADEIAAAWPVETRGEDVMQHYYTSGPVKQAVVAPLGWQWSLTHKAVEDALVAHLVAGTAVRADCGSSLRRLAVEPAAPRRVCQRCMATAKRKGLGRPAGVTDTARRGN